MNGRLSAAQATLHKLRAQDLAAANEINSAQEQTLHAARAIKQIGQINESDAIVLLHTLLVQIELSADMHAERWQNLTEALGVEILTLDEELTKDRAHDRLLELEGRPS